MMSRHTPDEYALWGSRVRDDQQASTTYYVLLAAPQKYSVCGWRTWTTNDEGLQ